MNVMNNLSTCVLFALAHTALLAGFMPRQEDKPRAYFALVLALSAAMQTAARLFETRTSLTTYLCTAALYVTMVVFLRLWSGEALLPIAQRAICFLLITESVTLALSYFSQRLLGRDLFRTDPLAAQALSLLGLCLLEAALLALLRRFLPKEPCADRGSLWLSFLSAIPYLFVSQITLWLPLTNEQLTAAVPLMLCASSLLSLLLIVSLEGRLAAERDKRQMLAQQHMMRMAQQQYEMTKTSVETVRRHYHDMKNLLLCLQNAGGSEDARRQITQVLEEIRPYETQLDTGSEVADLLLGEKATVCLQEGIACTVMTDGAALSFIRPLDLVTILGNALDNAIEACRAMPAGAARYIQVRTAQRQGFLLLQVRNSCTGEARMENERFVTTKEDPENHGFGLKNIRRAVHSYGGEMTCAMENQEFTLTLLFPHDIPTKEAN